MGKGEVATLLPTIVDYGVIQKAIDSNSEISKNPEEINNVLNLILKTISKNNPNFFSNFSTNIRSGNHTAIQETLLAGAIEMQKAVIEIAGISEKQLETELNKMQLGKVFDSSGNVNIENVKAAIANLKAGFSASSPSGRDQCFALVVIVAIAFAVAAIVNIVLVVEYGAAAIDVKVIVREEEATRISGASFVREKLINEIAEILKK
ncbi:hypothetical protein WSM22_19170 [Cytophagales bacterium WSM2-2]|nr:hypothetical protein WSM22_19170 [Cytophagales bacterium WSM2-2]